MYRSLGSYFCGSYSRDLDVLKKVSIYRWNRWPGWVGLPRSVDKGSGVRINSSSFPPFCYHSTMALNIKDTETERLAAEVSALAHESKTRAVKTSLLERRERLLLQAVNTRRAEGFRRFISEEVWPQVPENVRGKSISRKEKEQILGYGPSGV